MHIEKFPSSPLRERSKTVIFVAHSFPVLYKFEIAPICPLENLLMVDIFAMTLGLCVLQRHNHVLAMPVRVHQVLYRQDSLQPQCNTDLLGPGQKF